jgi:RNA polymerase sigma factor (sigma-70 family)
VEESQAGKPPDATADRARRGVPDEQRSDAELLARLVAGDQRAVAELYARWLPPLVQQARARQVDAAERRELVLDLLADVALGLMRGTLRPPRSLGGYLVTALRRRLIDRHRRRLVRRDVVPLDEARDVRSADAAPDHASVDGPAARDATDDASVALTALARHLERHLDETDVRIVLWLGERVPQRTIAEWIGTSHGALRMRVSRLREALRQVARTWVATLDGEERAEVARFFRRAAPAAAPTPRRPADRAPGGRHHDTST